MESLRKASEMIESQIKLAEFLKEVKEKIPSFENLPVQIENLGRRVKELMAEISSLEEKKKVVVSEIEAEKKETLDSINAKLKEANDMKSAVETEKAQVANDKLNVSNRERELQQLIETYTNQIKDVTEKQSILDEKLKLMRS